MNETISDLRARGREPQIASTCRIHSVKCVDNVAGLSAVPCRTACASAEFAREADSTGGANAPAISLWRLSLSGTATDRREVLAYALLAVGSAVSLWNGFGRLDGLLVNWPSFVDLVQRVFF